jgi:hypothetical protein
MLNRDNRSWLDMVTGSVQDTPAQYAAVFFVLMDLFVWLPRVSVETAKIPLCEFEVVVIQDLKHLLRRRKSVHQVTLMALHAMLTRDLQVQS